MLWRKRFRRRLLYPVAGWLVALFALQLTHDFVAPNLVPSLLPVAEAAYNTIEADGDSVNVAATQTTCGGLGNFDCIDDGVGTSSVPNTTGDYLTFAEADQDYYTMETFTNVDTVNQVRVPVYHQETETSMSMQVSLWDASETTQYGATQTLTSSLTSQWDTATFSGLSLSQTQLDGLRVRLECVRPGGGKKGDCNVFAAYAGVNYTESVDVTVGSLGAQQDLKVGTTSAHVGGAFSVVENTSSRDITSITITENGSVDAQNDLSNVELYYELDTNTPFDCSGLSYDGTETQYGSTDTDGFSSANGTSTFTDTVTITTTQAMCVYVVTDVATTASAAETIEIEISDPATDVVGSGSPIVSPSSAVLLSDTTTLLKTVLTQVNYHWRNDDGDETDTASGATSATGGTENTSYDTFPKEVTKRLRLAISNDGNATSSATQYRLEFAQKAGTCEASTGWGDIGSYISTTTNLTDGNDTTNIAESSGGVSDPNTTFLTPNGGVKDENSQTGDITLAPDEFVELEYAVKAASFFPEGVTYCLRVTASGTPIAGYTNYAEATFASDVIVDTLGTQTDPVEPPVTDQYAGGTFRITHQDTHAGTDQVTDITITASGTVDAQNDISNITLRYDLDTTDPHTCDDQSYAVTDSQFGTTVANFDVSDQATFTDSVNASTTQTVCLYVEYDAASNIQNGQTLDLAINDPSSEVVVSNATVGPSSPAEISGVTSFASAYTEQTNYHWRNNDGDETGASSATGGNEDTALQDITKNTIQRLRLGVANTGLASADGYARLEWVRKVSTCDAATGWTRIDTAGDDWEMAPTGNLTDGSSTTDIAIGIGGVSDGASTFYADNGGIKDTTDTTGFISVGADTYFDLEYAIQATDAAVQGASYCFRITNNGQPLHSYTSYPEVSVKLDTDYKIQRGTFTMTSSSTTLVAGTDYEALSTTERAFIRITNTQLTGAGPNTGNSSNNADDVTVYITNPGNIVNDVTFQRAQFAGGNTRVSWEIVEYTGAAGGENEMVVRQQEAVSYTAAGTSVSGAVTNTVTDDADVAVFITAQHNRDTGRNAYHEGLSTAAWNTGTNQVDLTRAAGGEVSDVSYALVEFTGSNWNIQRVEHTYTSAGTVETSPITAVNSLSRTFLHVQKRTTQNDHADFGHEVWLSGIGQVSFLLDPAAVTPSEHTSVAWVIENTQTQGEIMEVTRSNGSFTSAGAGPETNSVSIGKTIEDLTITSLFVNNRSDETQRSWPEPILGATIASSTHYELWRSDTSANINYRTEVVEWPTAARKLEQNYYRLYDDNDALTPSDPWPAGAADLGENTEMTADDEPLALGDTVRIRMTLSVKSSAMPAGLDSFTLQYAERTTTCSAVSAWQQVGGIGSTTAPWRGVNNTPNDGTALSTDPPAGGDLLISIGTVAGTYEEANDSALNPHTAFPGDEVEYDWVVQHNGAKDKTSYCFRMVEPDGGLFQQYHFFPVIRTVGYEPVLSTWRFYDDETNITPTTPLAAENTAPIDIQNDNTVKLRLTLEESSGAAGENNKFLVQYSEYADFSQEVHTLTSTTTCTEDSFWCYADGAGVDNARIDSAVISDADACSGGTGNGCGTHNEGTSTASATYDQPALTTAEYEFTLQHAGARANAVYYFRLYDVTTSEFVGLGATSSYPSVVTEGPQLVFSVNGVDAGTSIAGIVTDATSTATSIDFGSVPFNTDREVAQEIIVDTNATEGYQVYKYADQQLLNTYGTQIEPITGTNVSPEGWSTSCAGTAVSCFGYHTTDATLEGGDGRFAPIDSYAALSTSLSEIMYSSVPANDAHNVIYRMRVSEEQVAGDYQTSITYIAVPVF